ncbi:MAG TPA: PDZ domain-containing protein [Candidatus Methylomirabilis sp.]|nr:PDZ domain-containing protein [Candidatus Methylomirabilis sp.]
MSRTGLLWPAALALALCLGLMTTAAAPRVQAQDDEDGAKKKIVRVYTKDDDSGEESGAGYLGVQVQDLTRSLKRAMDLEDVEGALVNGVADGSPADDAGIRKGDVILRVGRTDTPGASELTRAIREMKPGEKTTVVVLRDGDRKSLPVALGSRPKDEDFEVRLPGGGRWHGDGDATPPGAFMFRHQQEMEQQMQDLREEIEKLTEEIRQLRIELQRGSSRR